MYTRITRTSAPEQPIRRALLDAITKRPGQRLVHLVVHLGKPRSTIVHHLRILMERHLVVAETTGRISRFYVAGARPRAGGSASADPRMERLVQLLRRGGSRTQAEIAAQLGVSQSFVSKLMRRLQQRGLMERRRLARGTLYTFAPTVPGNDLPDLASRPSTPYARREADPFGRGPSL
jgi:predicted transcriptional regulator